MCILARATPTATMWRWTMLVLVMAQPLATTVPMLCAPNCRVKVVQEYYQLVLVVQSVVSNSCNHYTHHMCSYGNDIQQHVVYKFQTYGYVSLIGGVVEVLFDAHNLDTTAESLDRGHVSVQDVLKELNARLSTVSLID